MVDSSDRGLNQSLRVSILPVVSDSAHFNRTNSSLIYPMRVLPETGRGTKSMFLAHLAFRPCELLPSLFVRRLSSVVRPSTFHIIILSSETTGPIGTKLWWNGQWMASFQNCVRWSRLPTKMATKLKIEIVGIKF